MGPRVRGDDSRVCCGLVAHIDMNKMDMSRSDSDLAAGILASGRIGILIVNLGTPDGTDAASVRTYLREFLSDARVIEDQGLLWKFVLNCIILVKRPKAKGRDYETIWNREKNESPLKTITRAQAAKLRDGLSSLGPGVIVDWAMRYGNPSMDSRIEAMMKAGCERILLVPLYPQYAAATSATVCDKTFDALKAMRWQPAAARLAVGGCRRRCSWAAAAPRLCPAQPTTRGACRSRTCTLAALL